MEANQRLASIAACTLAAVGLLMAGCANTGGVAPRDALKDPASLDSGAAIRAAVGEAGWPGERWWTAYNDP